MYFVLDNSMRGQTSWMWFMFGITQIFLGTSVSPELEILGTLLNVNGGGFLLLAIYFLFRRDRKEKWGDTRRKAERTTLVRGEDGQIHEVALSTSNSKLTLVMNIIWLVMVISGWIFV